MGIKEDQWIEQQISVITATRSISRRKGSSVLSAGVSVTKRSGGLIQYSSFAYDILSILVPKHDRLMLGTSELTPAEILAAVVSLRNSIRNCV